MKKRGRKGFIGSLCENGAPDYHEPYVYFAEDPATKLVKVGTTSKGRMLIRMRELSMLLGRTVTLLAMTPGGIRLERQFHRGLQGTRANREWFRPSMQLDEFIRNAGGRVMLPAAAAYWHEWAGLL